MSNKTIESFTRTILKEKVALCTPKQQHIFKIMYSHKEPEKLIDQVVDDMPQDKLDWALTQVERTLEKNNAKV